jgi:hypothetical protein
MIFKVKQAATQQTGRGLAGKRVTPQKDEYVS